MLLFYTWGKSSSVFVSVPRIQYFQSLQTFIVIEVAFYLIYEIMKDSRLPDVPACDSHLASTIQANETEIYPGQRVRAKLRLMQAAADAIRSSRGKRYLQLPDATHVRSKLATSINLKTCQTPRYEQLESFS